MKRIRSALTLIIVTLGTVVTLSSHSSTITEKGDVNVGIQLGYGIAPQNATITKIYSDTNCLTYDGATASGFYAGLNVQYSLSRDYSVLIRTTYFSSTTTFTSRFDKLRTRGTEGEVVPLVLNYELNANTSFLLTDATFCYSIDELDIFGGLNISYQVKPEWNSSSTVSSPSNVTFSDGSKARTEFSNTKIENTNTLLFGATLGCQYTLKLTENISLIPCVSITVPFTEVSAENKWSLFFILPGVGLSYRL